MTSAYASVCEYLDSGGAIVTATRRQRHELTAAYSRWQRDRDRTVWPTPDVLPWTPWLQRSWLQLSVGTAGAPQLLSTAQSASLWQAVVNDSGDGRTLIDPRQAARSAQQAHALLQQWALPLDLLRHQAAALNLEQATFLRWLEQYLRRCAEANWCDDGALPGLLRNRDAAALRLPRLGLFGFAELTPAQRATLDWLRGAGTAIDELAPGAQPGETRSFAAKDVQQELDAILAWALRRLAADRQARLGVIIPESNQRAGWLRRQLDDRLHPELQRPGAQGERIYSLSAAPSLADHPVVAAALDLLGLTGEVLPFERLSTVLRSPYLRGAEGELTPRAALEIQLRRHNLLRVSRARLLALAGRDASACPLLVTALQSLWERLAQEGGRRWPSDWCNRIAAALTLAGWPEGRALDSEEYQVARRFRESLGELGSLDRIAGRIRLTDALRELRQIVREIRFQPEEGSPRLLILDAHVDPMLELDGLWVAGLTADRWPAAAAPHPLLPPALQVQSGMPHASAAVELAFARRTLASWQLHASEVILSWPRADGDLEFDASPLLDPRLPEYAADAVPPTRAAVLQATAGLEAFDDAPPARLPPGMPLRGGTRTLELQARCPFRAMAEQRLFAEQLSTPVPGIDRRARGTLAHESVALLWSRVRDSTQLAALSLEQRSSAVAQAIDAAVLQLPVELRHLRIVELERRWLAEAIETLLLEELRREPFVVAECELATTLDLDGHRLDVRIDRVDRLSDGAVAIIDYKTGVVAPGSWFGDRPEQPQLPTYAAHLGARCGAVVFAQLTHGRSSFKGMAERDGTFPQVPTTATTRLAAARKRPWTSLIDEWARTTSALAARFAAGEAAVDPAPGACRYCHLSMLCRIDARAVEPETVPEADSDD